MGVSATGVMPGLGGKGGSAGQPEVPAFTPPTQGQYAPLAPQGQFNVNQAAAGALQQAMQGTQAGMSFQAAPVMPVGFTPTTQQVQGQQRAYGYTPAQQQLQGQQTGFSYSPTSQRVMGSQQAQTYDPAQQRMVAQRTGFDYDPSQQRVTGQRTGFDYDPTMARAQTLAGTDISQYESPYQQAVIDRALSDISKSQEQSLNQLGAQATAARAFGGSRQGIAEAETRKGFAEQAADTAASLRERGFQQAMGAAQFDVGQRAATEAANVAARQAAERFGAGSAEAAQAANVAQRQQVEAANVAARQAAEQFGAGSAQAAQAANVAQRQQIEAQNVASRTAAEQFAAQQRSGAQAANIAQRQQVEAANAAAATAAAQYGAGSAQAAQAANIARQQQIEAQNVAARTGAAQYGAGARTAAEAANIQRAQQVAASNAAAQTAASQFGATAAQTAQQQNFSNQLAALQARQGAASQLAGLGQQAFGTGQAIQQQQMQQGLMQQGLQQSLIDAARGQYTGFTGAPQASLGLPLAALGAQPNQSTTTQSKNPGLFDYLALAATAIPKSDIRLKKNIKPLGTEGGINVYSWDWNEDGKRVADPAQPTVGVMAQELQETHPHLVQLGSDGFLRVDYKGLAAEMA